MITIAVCDDEKLMLNAVSHTVKTEFQDAGVDFNLTTYLKGTDLLKKHTEKPFNILFLDISMPNNLSGFEIAQKAREISKDIFIIFVTSNDELVYESFSYQPFYFVKKNTDTGLRNDVAVVVRKLISHMRQYESMLLEFSPGRKSSVLYRNIMYIKSDKHYLEYYISDGTIARQRGTMSDVEQSLAEHGFIKVHKRNLINMNYIKCIDNRMLEIQLKNNTKLEMSRNYKTETEERYIKFMRSLI